jgi:uncharacterized membrane protein HdeD (DUF308 family)
VCFGLSEPLHGQLVYNHHKPTYMASLQITYANTARSLRALYYIRAAFNIIWVALITINASASQDTIAILLIIYPLWDVIGTIADILINRGTDSLMPQYVNLAISAVAAIAVAFAIRDGIPNALLVFGIWAIIAGVIQLVTALRRQKQLGAQWPIMISGGQSTIGGLAIILLAHHTTFGLLTLAGYAAFGAFYFLLGAISITKRLRKGF